MPPHGLLQRSNTLTYRPGRLSADNSCLDIVNWPKSALCISVVSNFASDVKTAYISRYVDLSPRARGTSGGKANGIVSDSR